MTIKASVRNSLSRHEAVVETNGMAKTLAIPSKATGFGSGVNGGELLLLALATCFCNDLYREAGKKGIHVLGVEVDCTAEFGADGEPGAHFKYSVRVNSEAPRDQIEDLIRTTDAMAEVHNTLRAGVKVEYVPA